MAKDIKSFESEWGDLAKQYDAGSNVKAAIDYLYAALTVMDETSKEIKKINSKFDDSIGAFEPTLTKATIDKLEDGRTRIKNFCENIHDELIDVIDAPFTKKMSSFSETVYSVNPEEIIVNKTGDAVGAKSTLYQFINEQLENSVLKMNFEKYLKDLQLEPSEDLGKALDNMLEREKNNVLKQIGHFLDAKNAAWYKGERINDVSRYLSMLLFNLEPYMSRLTPEEIARLKNLDGWKNISEFHKTAAEAFVKEFEGKFMVASKIVNAENIFGLGSIKPPQEYYYTDEEIRALIASGLFSQQDYEYLAALSKEATSYETYYAVACNVRNRVNHSSFPDTYKEVVTSGAYSGYVSVDVGIGNQSNRSIVNATVAVLLGGDSTISDYIYFFGRYGNNNIWYRAEKVGDNLPIVIGDGTLRNVYYKEWKTVSNANDAAIENTSDAVIIYDSSTKTWHVPK
ncbi:MAG: cell wall hydrolase [Lachnospiraceae bacterium]|nr:cell wall hydrolase [Lachnospiraceae bacterium]